MTSRPNPGPGPGLVTWAGLAVVAVSAAVLSFAAVRDLAASACYPAALAWLLPVVIDTAAVVASRIWLGRAGQPAAVGYARTLALTAAAVTIAANVVQHALVAYQLVPAWWLVAALAAVPPAALVAVAHLVALLTRPPPLDQAVSDAWAGQEPTEALAGPGPHPDPERAPTGPAAARQRPVAPVDGTAVDGTAVDCADQVADVDRVAPVGGGGAGEPRVAELTALLAAGEPVTGAQAAVILGCSPRTGRRLLDLARQAAAPATRRTAAAERRPALHLITPTPDRNGAS